VKSSEQIAIIYHSLFNYLLSKEELVRWKAGKSLSLNSSRRKNIIHPTSKKIGRNDLTVINRKKMEIAEKAAAVLSKIPSILFIGVTGSLSMNNAKDESDIDFMIITKANTLWLTRIFSLLLLLFSGFKIRRAQNKDEKNKICLNLWLDERSFDLPYMPRNVYTAHEIAQVVTLVNKNKTKERWYSFHDWVSNFWPNAITFPRIKNKSASNTNQLLVLLNVFAYSIQYLYMSRKLTRERVALHYAYFHPFDWGDIVNLKLKKHGVVQIFIEE
jgi:predicted nucleotidyltransferase